MTSFKDLQYNVISSPDWITISYLNKFGQETFLQKENKERKKKKGGKKLWSGEINPHSPAVYFVLIHAVRLTRFSVSFVSIIEYVAAKPLSLPPYASRVPSKEKQKEWEGLSQKKKNPPFICCRCHGNCSKDDSRILCRTGYMEDSDSDASPTSLVLYFCSRPRTSPAVPDWFIRPRKYVAGVFPPFTYIPEGVSWRSDEKCSS